MVHSRATITGLADSEICLSICVIYDSHEGVDVTIPPRPPPKDYRCVKIHWFHFSKQKVQIRCFRRKQVDEGLEHKGTDSCLITKLPHNSNSVILQLL